MLYYFRKYPVSLIIVAIIFYLSFFTPPKTDVEEIPYIDKIVHICMYGGLCFILWIEYLRNHKAINWNHVIWGGIIAPVAMSGCIELMQAYCTDTRSGDWLDFLANSIGVGLAALIVIPFYVHLFGEGYYIERTSHNTQVAAFATLGVYYDCSFDFCHNLRFLLIVLSVRSFG